MASPTGGRFVFAPPSGFPGVTLGINLGGGAPVFPTPVGGNFNIEVFTAASVTGSPSSLVLDTGFQDGIIDHGAGLPGGFLSGNTLELGSGNYFVVDDGATITGASAASIVGGTGDQTIFGAKGDVQIGGSGTQVLNSLLQGGGESVFGGSGATTVYAGAADVVVGGSGNEYLDGTAGNVAIKAGSAGNETINGSFGNGFSGVAAGPDTLTGGAAAVDIQGLGAGDQVNFVNQTGNATINAQAYVFDSVTSSNVTVAASNAAVTLGGGAATVFGGFGDTISLGSADQYADGYTGGNVIRAGAAGTTDQIFGSAVAGGGDTILAGGGANVNFNIQAGGGDLIDLAGSTGANTVQAFGIFPGGVESDVANVNDTIIAGAGSNSVFGGSGDRIGAGGAGTDLFLHSTTIAGATVGFGTNAPSGAANVTVGAVDTTGGANTIVGGFDQTTDFIFYQNETTAENAVIVASAQDVAGGINGNPAMTFTLEGSTMTLIGVTKAEFQTAGGFIKV